VPRLPLTRFCIDAAGGVVLGTAIAAWYLFPVLADYRHLMIANYESFFNPRITPLTLAWPVFSAATAVHYGWACQFGTHFLVAAAALPGLLAARRCPADRPALVALAILAVLVALVLWGADWPLVQPLLKPVQWNYRLLMPAGLCAAVVLAAALDAGAALLPRKAARVAAIGLGAYVLFLAGQYYADARGRFIENDAYLPSNDWVFARHFDSPGAIGYSFRGNDYNDLGWVAADGPGTAKAPVAEKSLVLDSLVLDKDFALQRDGLPFRFLLRTGLPAGSCDVTVLFSEHVRYSGLPWTDPVPLDLTCAGRDGFQEYSGRIAPPAGISESDRRIRFVSAAGRVPVRDLAFVPDGDVEPIRAAGKPAFRTAADTTQIYDIAGPAGLYQIPVVSFSRLAVTADGIPQHIASADRHMVLVRLEHGTNLITLARGRDRLLLLFWAGIAASAVLLATGLRSRRVLPFGLTWPARA
jgi:hypothetical protein